MSFNTAIRYGHPIIFTLLILFSIIELSISAWLISRFNSGHPPVSHSEGDRVRFILFCSIWTLVTAPFFMIMFLIAALGNIFSSVAAHIIYLFVTWALWTGAASAITDTLGGGRGLDCGTQVKFLFCGQLNTLEAFAWMIWIVLTIAIIAAVIRGIVAAKAGEGYGGGLVKE
ncbi:hypothetical protein AX17_002239 [Amanita inopinata Kibby_2008]|nr:hypothetical protein AX17_002239 [Amanita inopinata Kibby_2008]